MLLLTYITTSREIVKLRPVAEFEQSLNQRRRFDNPNLTNLYRLAERIDGTMILIADLFFGVEEEQHFVSYVTGKTGSSKSTIMKKLMSMNRLMKWRLKGIASEFLLTWSPIQSQAKAQLGKLSRWTDVGQDEFRKSRIGKGAATSEAGFITMTESLREEKNSFCTCSIRKPNLETHFSLRARGYIKGDCIIKGRGQMRDVSMALLYGPEHNLPMAMVYLDEVSWPIDPYIDETYLIAKRAYNALVKKYGGNVPEVSPEVIQLVENQFMEYLEDHHADEMLELTKTELEDIYIREAKLTTVYYMEGLLSTIHAKLQRKKRRQDAKVKMERIQAEEERTEEQWKSIREVIAPRMVEHFLKMTDEDMTPPKRSVLRDYIRGLKLLEEQHFTRCMDRFEALWQKEKRRIAIVGEAKERSLRPPPITPSDFNTDELFWLEEVKKRNPKLIPENPDYFGAYKSYLEKERGFESQRKAANTLDISRRTLRGHFESIAGAIKATMGYEFERVIVQLYQTSEARDAGVLRIEPDGDEVAPKGQPDRIVYLEDGRTLICSWKCHSKNESIKIKDSPEWKLTEDLLQQGENAIMVLEGLFADRYFRKEISMKTGKDSVRIKESDFMSWPPSLKRLLSPPAQKAEAHLEQSPAPQGATGEGVVISGKTVSTDAQLEREPDEREGARVP